MSRAQPRRRRPADPVQRLIEEQIAYYRNRAGEYDATSTPPNDPFAAHADVIRAALRAFEPRGRVLELAAGTGQWTSILAEYADELTATDAAPEMLALNAAKVGDPSVRYVVADAFAYEPDRSFDVVFFGFFLSHVPRARFETFWSTVRRCLADDGRVFFVDEARHGLWDEAWVTGESGGVVERRLNDGSLHRAVKVLWPPDDLEVELRALGWAISVRGVGPFYWGSGAPLRD
jgi:demethylmenaquinone methyltransferase/2-methoxy-6-polyprenyl-1,4-benzoquinol methylase